MIKNTKEARDIRDLIGDKPDHFKGNKGQWRKLVNGLLIPPDPNKTWVKRPNGEWEKE